MPTIAQQNKSRTLHADDQAAVCFLYPVAGEVPCESSEQCPRIVGNDAQGEEFYSGEFSCVEGLCANPLIYATGIANLGEECVQDAACADGLYCQPWQDTGVCARYCETAAPDCEVGFDCNGFKNYPKYGTCLPAGGVIYAPGTGPLGCASSVVCGAEKSCLPTPLGDKRLCTTICVVADPASCPEGEQCWQYSEGKDTGACFAEGLWPGAEPEPAPEPAPDAGGEPDPGPMADAGGVGAEEPGVGGDAGSGPAAEGPEATSAKGGAADDGCAGGPAPAGGPPAALTLALLGLLALVRRRR
jgi:MYXO-CTERM domain-containing protein